MPLLLVLLMLLLCCPCLSCTWNRLFMPEATSIFLTSSRRQLRPWRISIPQNLYKRLEFKFLVKCGFRFSFVQRTHLLQGPSTIPANLIWCIEFSNVHWEPRVLTHIMWPPCISTCVAMDYGCMDCLSMLTATFVSFLPHATTSARWFGPKYMCILSAMLAR